MPPQATAEDVQSFLNAYRSAKSAASGVAPNNQPNPAKSSPTATDIRNFLNNHQRNKQPTPNPPQPSANTGPTAAQVQDFLKKRAQQNADAQGSGWGARMANAFSNAVGQYTSDLLGTPNKYWSDLFNDQKKYWFGDQLQTQKPDGYDQRKNANQHTADDLRYEMDSATLDRWKKKRDDVLARYQAGKQIAPWEWEGLKNPPLHAKSGWSKDKDLFDRALDQHPDLKQFLEGWHNPYGVSDEEVRERDREWNAYNRRAQQHELLIQTQARGVAQAAIRFAEGLLSPQMLAIELGSKLTAGGAAEAAPLAKQAASKAAGEAVATAAAEGANAWDAEVAGKTAYKAVNKATMAKMTAEEEAKQNITTLTAKKVIHALMSAGFSAQMIMGIPPALQQAEKQSQEGDVTGATRSYTDALLSAVFGAFSGAHAIGGAVDARGTWKSEADVRATLEAGAQEKFKKPFKDLTPDQKSQLVYESVSKYGTPEATQWWRQMRLNGMAPGYAEVIHTLENEAKSRFGKGWYELSKDQQAHIASDAQLLFPQIDQSTPQGKEKAKQVMKIMEGVGSEGIDEEHLSDWMRVREARDAQIAAIPAPERGRQIFRPRADLDYEEQLANQSEEEREKQRLWKEEATRKYYAFNNLGVGGFRARTDMTTDEYNYAARGIEPDWFPQKPEGYDERRAIFDAQQSEWDQEAGVRSKQDLDYDQRLEQQREWEERAEQKYYAQPGGDPEGAPSIGMTHEEYMYAAYGVEPVWFADKPEGYDERKQAYEARQAELAEEARKRAAKASAEQKKQMEEAAARADRAYEQYEAKYQAWEKRRRALELKVRLGQRLSRDDLRHLMTKPVRLVKPVGYDERLEARRTPEERARIEEGKQLEADAATLYPKMRTAKRADTVAATLRQRQKLGQQLSPEEDAFLKRYDNFAAQKTTAPSAPSAAPKYPELEEIAARLFPDLPAEGRVDAAYNRILEKQANGEEPTAAEMLYQYLYDQKDAVEDIQNAPQPPVRPSAQSKEEKEAEAEKELDLELARQQSTETPATHVERAEIDATLHNEIQSVIEESGANPTPEMTEYQSSTSMLESLVDGLFAEEGTDPFRLFQEASSPNKVELAYQRLQRMVADGAVLTPEQQLFLRVWQDREAQAARMAASNPVVLKALERAKAARETQTARELSDAVQNFRRMEQVASALAGKDAPNSEDPAQNASEAEANANRVAQAREIADKYRREVNRARENLGAAPIPERPLSEVLGQSRPVVEIEPETYEALTAKLEETGKTLDELLATSDGTQLAMKVFGDRAEDYLDKDGNVTEEGKALLKRALVEHAIGEKIDGVSPSVIEKVVPHLPALARLKARAAAWHLGPWLAEALRDLTDLEMQAPAIERIGTSADSALDRLYRPLNFPNGEAIDPTPRPAPNRITEALAKTILRGQVDALEQYSKAADTFVEGKAQRPPYFGDDTPVAAFNREIASKVTMNKTAGVFEPMEVEQIDFEQPESVTPLEREQVAKANEPIVPTPEEVAQQENPTKVPEEIAQATAEKALAEEVRQGEVTPETLRSVLMAHPDLKDWADEVVFYLTRVVPNATGLTLAEFLQERVSGGVKNVEEVPAPNFSRGAYDAAKKVIELRRNLESATNANIWTVFEEFFHAMAPMLKEPDREKLYAWARKMMSKDPRYAFDAKTGEPIGAGTWTAHQEVMAKAWLHYLATGEVAGADSRIKLIFSKLKTMLRALYNILTGYTAKAAPTENELGKWRGLNIKPSQEIREIFDRWNKEDNAKKPLKEPPKGPEAPGGANNLMAAIPDAALDAGSINEYQNSLRAGNTRVPLFGLTDLEKQTLIDAGIADKNGEIDLAGTLKLLDERDRRIAARAQAASVAAPPAQTQKPIPSPAAPNAAALENLRLAKEEHDKALLAAEKAQDAIEEKYLSVPKKRLPPEILPLYEAWETAERASKAAAAKVAEAERVVAGLPLDEPPSAETPVPKGTKDAPLVWNGKQAYSDGKDWYTRSGEGQKWVRATREVAADMEEDFKNGKMGGKQLTPPSAPVLEGQMADLPGDDSDTSELPSDDLIGEYASDHEGEDPDEVGPVTLEGQMEELPEAKPLQLAPPPGSAEAESIYADTQAVTSFVQDMESDIAGGKSDASLLPWGADHNDAKTIAATRKALEERGWKWNAAKKQLEKDGWYVWFRSQGKLSAPIAQWNRLEGEAAAIVKKPASASMKLTQDWGVPEITGYSEDPDRENGNPVKDRFLKEARQYFYGVAKELAEVGFTQHLDKKGKPSSAVNVNESGPASSGEVSLTMLGPNDSGIYAQISSSSVGPHTKSGVSILYRKASKADIFGTKSRNKWAPVDLTAAELADLFREEAGVQKPGELAPLPQPTASAPATDRPLASLPAEEAAQTLAPPPQAEDTTPRGKFLEAYKRHLAAAVRKFPDRYKWPVENVPEVAERMIVALEKGTANLDSPAIQATLKELGIKNTRKAINEYFGVGEKTPAAKPEKPSGGPTPAQMAQQARADKYLDTQVQRHDGSVRTRRQIMDERLSQGWRVWAEEVPDDARKRKIERELAQMRRTRGGYGPPPNENHPDRIKYEALKKELAEGPKMIGYFAESGDGEDDRIISKTEYDYARQVKGEPGAAPAPAETPTPPETPPQSQGGAAQPSEMAPLPSGEPEQASTPSPAAPQSQMTPPPAAESTERAKWPDGRLKPQEGDTVFQIVAGFGGMPASIRGTVVKNRKGELRIQHTGTNALIGGSGASGRTYPVDESWTVQNDPELKRREEARAARDKEKADAEEKEKAEEKARIDALVEKYGLLDPASVKFGDVLESPHGKQWVVREVAEPLDPGGKPFIGVVEPDDLGAAPGSAGNLRGWRKVGENKDVKPERPWREVLAEEDSAAEAAQKTPTENLVNAIFGKLKAGQPLGNINELSKLAEQHLGGSRASGQWTPKDLFDAMETAVNRYLAEQAPELMKLPPREALEKLRNLMRNLTTQSVRTDEQVKNQQFSTPPTEAYVVAKVADLRPTDVVLEPSAGNGGLVAFARDIVAQVHVNELTERRREMLRIAGFPDATGHDGEVINALLEPGKQPTVILMNPPFSASTTKEFEAKNRSLYGFNHVSSALQRLAPNGRLVAILGGGQANEPNGGASLTGGASGKWFEQIAKQYNIRANIRVDGAEYRKYGTAFATRIIVIDKTGPTKSLDDVVTKNVSTLEEAYDALAGIAADRPAAGPGDGEIAGDGVASPGVEPGDRTGVDSTGVRTTGKPRSSGGSRPGSAVGRDGGRPGELEPELRPESPEVHQPQSGPEPTASDDADGRAAGGAEDLHGERPVPRVEEGLKLEKAEDADAPEKQDTAQYVEYRPAVKGPAHPGAIVESKTMATVKTPEITYKPSLAAPLDSGKLSAVQLEAVALAGQQNEIILPSGARAAALIGDGTGVGKGREGAAILHDNWAKGRKRLVFVTQNADLMQALIRDLNGIGSEDLAKTVKPLSKFGGTDTINHEGVLFTTYPLLRAKDQNGNTRAAQVEQWLRGNDNAEGAYVVFDESHNLKNAIAGGMMGKASQIGVAVTKLLRNLPLLRTVSLSATAASDIMNLGYLDRLGLWGPGTPFPGGFNEFAEQIGQNGISAMEMVARELKAQGKYLARTLSYKGVTYDKLTHELTPEQKKIYRLATQAWASVFENAERTIANTTNGGGVQKAAFMQAFYGTQLRFFNMLLTTLKIPTVVEHAKQSLRDGKSVVITLVNTNEAAQNREKTKAPKEGEEEEPPEYDFGPGEMLIQLVKQNYPIQQWVDTVDQNGNRTKRPLYVRDKNGLEIPQVNPTAVAERDALIAQLRQNLRMPANPLDILIEAFGGPSKVAELTGRKEYYDEATGKFVPRGPEGVSRDKVNLVEAQNFQDGKKRVAILSGAAGTGISLQSDLGAKNQQKRAHYTLQPGWSADRAMQMLGRTHRTNQASAPEYYLVQTNLGGEKRFIATISRRLGALNAISKGQKDAGGQSEEMDKVNLESREGQTATNAFYERLLHGQIIPGARGRDGGPLSGMEVLHNLHILKRNKDGILTVPEEDKTNVTRLLNRMLALDPDVQSGVYDYFYSIFNAVVQHAIQEGTLDTGVRPLEGDEPRIVHERSISKDPKTNASTEYYKIETRTPTRRTSPDQFRKMLAEADDEPTVRIDPKSGRLLLTTQADPIVSADGSVTPSVWISRPDRRFVGKRDLSQAERVPTVLEHLKRLEKEAKDAYDRNRRDIRWREDALRNRAITNLERAEAKLAETKALLAQAEGENSRALLSSQVAEQQKEVDKWTAAVENPLDAAEFAQEWESTTAKPLRDQSGPLKDALEEAQANVANPMNWAEEEWTKQYGAAPDHEIETHHLIGGAVMRWWAPLRETDPLLRIYTAVDKDSGKRVVGVRIPPESIDRLLKRIEGGGSVVTSNTLIHDVIRNATRYELEQDIQVSRGRVGGESVIRLHPPSQRVSAALLDLGVKYERGVQPVYYIPANSEGHKILDSVLERYPVRGDADSTQSDANDPQRLYQEAAPEIADLAPEEEDSEIVATDGDLQGHMDQAQVKRFPSVEDAKNWLIEAAQGDQYEQTFNGTQVRALPDGRAVVLYSAVDPSNQRLYQEGPIDIKKLQKARDDLAFMLNNDSPFQRQIPAAMRRQSELKLAELDRQLKEAAARAPMTPPPSASTGKTQPGKVESIFPKEAPRAGTDQQRGKTDDYRGVQNPGGDVRLVQPATRPGAAGPDGRAGYGRGDSGGVGRTAPAGGADRGGVGGGRVHPETDRGVARPVYLSLKPPVRPRGKPLDPGHETEWRTLMRARKMPEETPPRTRTVDEDSAKVLDKYAGQKEQAETLLSGLDQFDGVILAAPTGGGKTFISLAAIKTLKTPESRILVVSKSRAILDQKDGWKRAGMQYFGLFLDNLPARKRVKAEGVKPGVYVGTYTELQKRMELAQVKWDLVVFDEAAEARRWYDEKPNKTNQGQAAMRVGNAAKKAIYVSAAPYHSAVEIGWMNKLGLWDAGKFDEWARQFGAYKGRSRFGPATIWKNHGVSADYLVALRDQLVKRGQFATQDIDMEGHTTDIALVQSSAHQREQVRNIQRAFQLAGDYYEQIGKQRSKSQARALAAIYLKNYLERLKLPQMIELAKRARAQGWDVAMFSENQMAVKDLWRFLEAPNKASISSAFPQGRIRALLPELVDVFKELEKGLGEGEVANYSGPHTSRRARMAESFLNGEKHFMYATYAAGGVGVSFHDTSEGGVRPKLVIHLGLPWSGMLFNQSLGRFWRYGTKSNVHSIFLVGDTRPEVDLVLNKVMPRLNSIHAAVRGLDQKDPLVRGMRTLTRAQAYTYELGFKAKYDPSDYVPVDGSVPIHDWTQAKAEMPNAEQAKGKGMKYPEKSATPTIQDRLFQEAEPERFLTPEESQARENADEMLEAFAEGEPVPVIGEEAQQIEAGDRMIAAERAAPVIKQAIAQSGQADPRAVGRRKARDAMSNVRAAQEAQKIGPVTDPAPGEPGWEMTGPKPPNPEKPKVTPFRWWHTLLSGMETVKAMTAAAGVPETGKEIDNRNRNYHAWKNYYAGQLQAKWLEIKNALKLTPQEIREMVMVKEGYKASNNPRVNKAVQQLTRIFNDVKDDLARRGISASSTDSEGRRQIFPFSEFGYDPNFWPHIFDYNEKIRLTDPQTGEEHVFTLKQLLAGTELSQIKKDRIVHAIMMDKKMTRQQVEAWLEDRRQPRPLAGNIERTRNADLPFYRMDEGALLKYFAEVGDVMARTEQFGQELEELNALIDKIPDEKARKNVKAIMTDALAPAPWSEDASRLYSMMTSAAVLTKMTFSPVKVPFHLIHTGLVLEQFRPVAKAILQGVANFKEIKQRAIFAGSLADSANAQINMELASRMKLSHKVLQLTGFNWLYQLDRIIASQAGRNWMAEYALPQLIKKAKSSEHIREQLREHMLMDDRKIDEAVRRGRWTEQDMDVGSAAFVNRTMFTSDPTEMPYFSRARVPERPLLDNIAIAGRVASALKSFQFKTAMLLKRQLIDEARNGNWAPWIPFLLAYPLAGIALQTASAQVHAMTGNPSARDKEEKELADLFQHPTMGKIAHEWVDAVAHATALTNISHILDVLFFPSPDKRKAQFARGKLPEDALKDVLGPYADFLEIGKMLLQMAAAGRDDLTSDEQNKFHKLLGDELRPPLETGGEVVPALRPFAPWVEKEMGIQKQRRHLAPLP